MIQILEFFLHLDQQIFALAATYGIWIYAILFLIIFAETGLVIAPFLPGDSLIFAAGALAGADSLNVFVLFLVLAAAAILGDSLNYWIGSHFGKRVFRKDTGFFFNKKHLITTEKFYETHGPRTIIIARFVPLVRTFAPFVAGIGKMKYSKFLSYNITGGLIWITLFLFGGYFFGNIPLVKENFTLAIIAIIFVSLIPVLINLIRKVLKRNGNHQHHENS